MAHDETSISQRCSVDPATLEILRRVAAKDPRYAVFLPEGERPAAPSRVRGVCRDLGDRLPGPCGAALHLCGRHGVACTRAGGCSEANRVCQYCPDHSEAQPASRHLVYHILPVAGNGVWQRGVDELRGRWDLFTGSKTVAVMTDPRPGWLDPPDAVSEYLPPGCELIELRNDPALREVVSWQPLWERVMAAAGEGDSILYAHAKGVTRPVDPGNSCQWWASLLYSLHLDHWPLVESQLTRHPITGAFKKHGHAFTGSASAWHYSGTFYWVRAGDFRRRAWRSIDRAWWGNESWPGLGYRAQEAGCVFYEAPQHQCDLYDPRLWADVIRPRYSEWLAQNPPAWPWLAAASR